ncbi:MAG: ThiF family adenylyltransferase [Coprobacillus sp.]|nr:ThiF family adenylyltransferase [Coprobacillus sp.]
MEDIYTRVRGLVGEEKFSHLKGKRVLIVGLGGVGGTVLESLIRSGVTHFHLIDFDKVEVSNLNRQILYDASNIGEVKVDVAKRRALSINPDAEIKTSAMRIDKDNIDSLLDGHYDFICDACDSTDAKSELARYALNKHIPFIMSGGAANQCHIEKVKITSLDKSEGDPLLKKMRTILRSTPIDLKAVNCAFFTQKNEKPSKLGLNSSIFATSSMGLAIGEYIFNSLL